MMPLKSLNSERLSCKRRFGTYWFSLIRSGVAVRLGSSVGVDVAHRASKVSRPFRIQDRSSLPTTLLFGSSGSEGHQHEHDHKNYRFHDVDFFSRTLSY